MPNVQRVQRIASNGVAWASTLARGLMYALGGTSVKPLLCLFCVVASAATVARGQLKPRVVFHDAERIALIGNEFFERDQDQEYIESQLTTRFPDKDLTFRNLGYSGDTVWADARSLCAGWQDFGPPEQGFKRLEGLVRQIKPTLIFLAYGMNESFDGPKGINHFMQGLDGMLDMLSSATAGARVVLISPIRHEDLGRPLPDPAEHNRNIRLYIEAMRKIAGQRGDPLIDLYDALGDGAKSDPPAPLTSDGIHLTPYGYWRAAQLLEGEMGYPPRTWRIQMKFLDPHPNAEGTRLTAFQAGSGLGSEFQMTFDATDAVLPLAPPPPDAPKAVLQGQVGFPGQQRLLRIDGLAPGVRYVLKADGQTIATATAEDWARGVQLRAGPAIDQEEQLRKLVIAKDFDFFNYWRPDNDTYIFGYRKHEQGRNAVEIPEFEPLLKAKEAEIAKLRVPARHSYVLRREPQ